MSTLYAYLLKHVLIVSTNESEYIGKFQCFLLTYIQNLMNTDNSKKKKRFIADLWYIPKGQLLLRIAKHSVFMNKDECWKDIRYVLNCSLARGINQEISCCTAIWFKNKVSQFSSYVYVPRAEHMAFIHKTSIKRFSGKIPTSKKHCF